MRINRMKEKQTQKANQTPLEQNEREKRDQIQV